MLRPRPSILPCPRGALPLLFLACLVGIFGCASNSAAPELLNVIDVAPREVDVGDRIEVLGTTLPTGEAKEAKVTFKGFSIAWVATKYTNRGNASVSVDGGAAVTVVTTTATLPRTMVRPSGLSTG